MGRAWDWLLPARDSGLREDRLASRSFRHLSRRIVADLGATDRGILIVLAAICRPAVMTETATMLAASFAREAEARVLLVDGGLSSSDLSDRFEARDVPGLADLLGNADLSGEEFVLGLGVDHVRFLSAGSPGSRTVHVNGALAKRTVDAFRDRYDVVLLTQGAVGTDTRYLPFAAEADLVLLIAEETVTRLEQIERAETLLDGQGIGGVQLILSRPVPTGVQAG